MFLFTDWTNVIKETNRSLAWDILVQQVNTILDTRAPFRISESQSQSPNGSPKSFFRRRMEDNKLRMKCSRNDCTMVKQQLKRDYFHKSIHESEGDSKKLWGKVNKAFGKKNKTTSITYMNVKSAPKEIVNDLTTFFTTVPCKLTSNWSNVTPNKTASTLHHPKLKLQPVSFDHVKKFLP